MLRTEFEISEHVGGALNRKDRRLILIFRAFR